MYEFKSRGGRPTKNSSKSNKSNFTFGYKVLEENNVFVSSIGVG
jgi:hypothetical protein